MPRNPTSWEKAHHENCLESLRNVTFKLLKRKTMKYKRSSETEGVDPKPAGFVLKNPAHSTLAHLAGFIPTMLSHEL